MRIFKFGGASVRDADSVRNAASILKAYSPPYVVVVSAMGKTTNALEKLTDCFIGRSGELWDVFEEIRAYHNGIVQELFDENKAEILQQLDAVFNNMKKALSGKPQHDYDRTYDETVSCGELLSTRILSAWLNASGIENDWLDARQLLITDACHREGRIDWEKTGSRVCAAISGGVAVTQGFIGATEDGTPTTLGREGSDYTAAILAYLLDAKELIIWKDVPGMLNANPKWFKNTRKLGNISYREAIELAFYGASVIHPKTIKPLQNKGIPLWIKSFVNPNETGTLINDNTAADDLIPSYIFKPGQVLLSISPRDFTFIVEENLSDIFSHFSQHRVHINLMQNSAINFTVCANDEERKINALVDDLQKTYKVLFNRKVELLTVRHYDEQTLRQLTRGKQILMEQKTRHTARLVLRDD